MIAGLLLCGLTAVGWLMASGSKTATAFIPMGAGIPILVSGILARDPARRKTAMHIAAGIALLGFLLCLGHGSRNWVKWFQGVEVNQLALNLVTAMGAICGVFLFLCVRSFIAARRSREGKSVA
jgi:TRAP-type C4-dicarboxylate transport system permease small subunit